MKDLTVIIPLHAFNEDIKARLDKAVESFNKANTDGESSLILSLSKAAQLPSGYLDGLAVKNGSIIESDSSNYQTLVNAGVNACKTMYFSILEYDDIFTDIWFKNVQAYVDRDTEDMFGFLSLTEVGDATQNNEIIGYANEAYWASSFSEEIGYLDLESTKDYLNFNTSGAVFKKDDFLALGGLKESMKYSHWLEFLLRALYKQKKMYVIPKVGYIHYIGVPGSMSETYANEMSEKEADWWIELAKKEYFFPQDRNKTYEE